MALYEIEKNSSGVPTGNYKHVAGRGKAEYGASTVRSGQVTMGAISAGGRSSKNVTFDSPMPDGNYLIVCTVSSSNKDCLTYNYHSQTASGFQLVVGNASSADEADVVVVYTAFKLYTDTEYNDVLDKVRDSGWIEATATSVLASGKVYYRTIGSRCVVYGENIKISSSATSPTNLVTGVPSCKYQPSNNIFVRSTGKSSDGEIWINPNETAIRTCIPSELAGLAVSINLDYFID